MQEFNAVAKGNVSDADLARAKLASYLLLPPSSHAHSWHIHFYLHLRNQLKASYLMSVETGPSLSQDIATQVVHVLVIQCLQLSCSIHYTREEDHAHTMSSPLPYSLPSSLPSQASLKGSYSPMTATVQQVDSITKEDVVQVSMHVDKAIFCSCT